MEMILDNEETNDKSKSEKNSSHGKQGCLVSLIYAFVLFIISAILNDILGSERKGPYIDYLLYSIPFFLLAGIMGLKIKNKLTIIIGLISISLIISYDIWRYKKEQLFDAFVIENISKTKVYEGVYYLGIDESAFFYFEYDDELITRIIEENKMVSSNTRDFLEGMGYMDWWSPQHLTKDELQIYIFEDDINYSLHLYYDNDEAYFAYIDY